MGVSEKTFSGLSETISKDSKPEKTNFEKWKRLVQTINTSLGNDESKKSIQKAMLYVLANRCLKPTIYFGLSESEHVSKLFVESLSDSDRAALFGLDNFQAEAKIDNLNQIFQYNSSGRYSREEAEKKTRQCFETMISGYGENPSSEEGATGDRDARLENIEKLRAIVSASYTPLGGHNTGRGVDQAEFGRLKLSSLSSSKSSFLLNVNQTSLLSSKSDKNRSTLNFSTDGPKSSENPLEINDDFILHYFDIAKGMHPNDSEVLLSVFTKLLQKNGYVSISKELLGLHQSLKNRKEGVEEKISNMIKTLKSHDSTTLTLPMFVGTPEHACLLLFKKEVGGQSGKATFTVSFYDPHGEEKNGVKRPVLKEKTGVSFEEGGNLNQLKTWVEAQLDPTMKPSEEGSTAFFKDVTVSTLEGESYSNNCVYSCLEYYMMRDLCGLEKMSLELDLSTSVKGVLEQSCALGEESFFTDDKNKGILVTNINSKQKALKGQFDSARKRFYDRKSQMDVLLGSEEIGEKCLQKMSTLMKGKDLAKTIDLNSFRQCYLAVRKYVRNMGTGVESIDEETKSVINDPYYKALEAIMDGDLSQKQDNDFMKSEITKKNGFFDLAIDSSLKTFFEKLKPYFPEEFKSEKASTELKKKLREFLKENWGSYKGKLSFAYTETSSKEGWYFLKEFAKDVLKDKNFKKEWVQLQMSYVNSNSDALKGEKLNNKFLFSKGILDDMKAYTANMSDSDKEDAIGQVVNWIINDDNFSKEDKQLTVKIFEKALGLRPQYEYLSYNTTAVNGLTETEIISKVREFEQQKQKLAELLEHQKVSWGSVKDVNKQNDANVNSFVSDYKKLAHALSLFDPNNKNAETKLFSQANQTNYGNFGLTMQDEDERIGNARTNFQNVVSDAQKLQGTIQATLGQYVQDLKNAYAEDQTEVTYIPKKEGKVKKLKDVSKSVTILKRSKGMLGMVLKKSDDDDVISKIDGFDKELNGHKENLKTEKESTASLSLKLNKVTKNEESSRAIETYKFQDEKNQEYASLLEHLIGSLNSKDELGLLKAQYYIGELEKRSNTPSDIQNLDTTKEFLIFARKKISRKQYYYEDLGRSEDHKFKNDLNTQYGVWSLPQTNLSYQKNQVIHIKDETLFKNIQATNGSNSLSECLQDIDRTKMYLHGSYFCYTQDMESSKPVFFGKKDLAKNLKHKSAVTESFHSDSEKEKFFNQLKSRYDLILSYKNKMLLKTISDTKSTNREALITQTKERLDGILSALGIDQTVDDFLTEKVKADNTALFKSYPNTEESFYQLLYDYKGLISNKPPYEEYASLGQWDRVEIFKGMELKKLVPFLMALLNKASEAPTNLKGLPLQGRIKQMDWISKIFNASSKKGQKIVSQTASGKTTIFLFMAMCFKHIKSMSVDETKAVFGENIDKLKTLPEKIVFCSPSKIPSSEGIDVAVLDPEVKTNGCLTLDLTKVEGVSVDDNGVLNFLPCIDEFHKYDLNDTVDIKYNKNGDSKIVKKTIGELLGLSAVMQLDFGWKKEENLSAIQESIQSDLETQKKEFDNLREKATALNREILRIGDEIGALDASDGTKINVEYEPDNDIITTAFGPYKVTGTNLRGPLSREFDTLLPGKKGVKSYWKKYFDEPYVKAGDNKQKKEDVIKKMVCRLKTLRQKILKEVLTPVASSYMQPSDLPNVWQVISKGSSHYIQEYRVSNPQYCPDKKTLAILCDFFNQLEEKLRPYIDASGIELPYEKRTSGRNPNVVEFEGKKVRLTSIFQEKITVAQSNPEEQLKKNREALKTKQNEMQTLKNKIKTQGELVQTLETSKKKVTDRSQKDKNKDLTFKDEWNDYKNAKQKLEKSIEKATFKNSDQDFVFKQDQYSHIAESLATKTLEQNDSVNTYIVGLPFVRFQGSEEPAHENSFINQLFNKFEEKNTTKPVRIFYKNQNGEQIVVMRESESGNIILQDLKKFYESNAMTDKDIKTNSNYTNATNIVLYAQNECTGGDFGEIVQCGDNDVARRKQIKMIAFHNIVSDDIKESPDKYNLADLMQFGGRLRTGNPNYSYRDIILPKGLKKNDALKAYSTCSNEKFKVSGDLYFGNIIADNFINLFKEGMKLSLKEEKTQRGKVSEKWKEIRDQLKKVVVDGETLVGLRNGIEIKKETDVNTMAEIMCKGFDALLDKNKNKAYLSYYRHKIKVRIKQYIELCLKEYKKEQERIKETYPVDN